MKELQFTFDGQVFSIQEGARLTIGRKGHAADLEIDDSSASRNHATLELKGESLFVMDMESLNGTYLNQKRLEPNHWVELRPEDELKIVGAYLKLVNPDGSGDPVTTNLQTAHFEEVERKEEVLNEPAFYGDFKSLLRSKKVLKLGRNQDNDFVLTDPTISRYHAELSYENNSYWVEDRDSLNGTYLNGVRIKGKREFRDTDTVVIALDSFTLEEGWVDLRTQRSAICAKNIFKQYPNKKVGLQPLSVDIDYASFVALMGPSGCGKSTLLKCLNGDNPASSGEVLIHGLPLRQNFNLLKRKIGYVPQDDIIHSELTVEKTLFYAAKLRLPDDTTDEEIAQRITKVINSLNLDQDKEKDIREVKVKDLSGGQRKRVSIAVELLVEPTILFLDEPTSPLDPESIASFLKSLQKLTEEGTTIIMVTHKPEDLNYVDSVIFLMVKGYMTYFGAANQLLNRFEVDDIVKVYAKLSDKALLKDHIERYYIRPIERTKDAEVIGDEVEKDKQDSLIIQFYWLLLRYLNIKITDRSNLLLLLSQPVIIGGLICLIFDEFQLGVLFLMAISAVWFGVSNSAKEIVGELAIYRRERMFNLNIHTYILSKWGVLSLIALIQTFIFVVIVYLKFRGLTTEGFDDIYLMSFGGSFAFMFYISFSATLIGLWLSSYFTTTERVMTVVPIALMPQIMLAGVITKIDNLLIEFVSFFTLGRWGTEGFARIQDSAYTALPDEEPQSVLRFLPQMDSIPSQDPNCACFNLVPNNDVLEAGATSASSLLDFYNPELIENNQLIGSFFDSMNANLLVVALLDIALYAMIYYSLKRKDSI